MYPAASSQRLSPDLSNQVDLPPLKIKKDFKKQRSNQKVVLSLTSSEKKERKTQTELKFHNSHYGGLIPSE